MTKLEQRLSEIRLRMDADWLSQYETNVVVPADIALLLKVVERQAEALELLGDHARNCECWCMDHQGIKFQCDEDLAGMVGE